MPTSSRRLCYLHVGTHKTGTTWLQDMLGRNAALLERSGTLVPRAGRPAHERGGRFIGHHNLAMEILDPGGFDASDGTLADLTHELASSTCERAIVSAEAFSFAHHAVGGLARLRDAVTNADFEPIVVFYFRGQATYARSIYTMSVIVYGWDNSFRAFCENVFAYRGVCTGTQAAPFDYDRLLKPFENTFGTANIVANAFDARANSRNLMEHFLSIVHSAPLDRGALQLSAPLNVGGSVAQVMDMLYARRAARVPNLPTASEIAARMNVLQATLERQFDPLDTPTSRRFYDTFAASNERLRAAYGTEIDNLPPPSPRGGDEQLEYIAACEAAWKNAGP